MQNFLGKFSSLLCFVTQYLEIRDATNKFSSQSLARGSLLAYRNSQLYEILKRQNRVLILASSI